MCRATYMIVLMAVMAVLGAPLWAWADVLYVAATTAEAEAGAGPTLNHTFGGGSNKIAIIIRCMRENTGAVTADTAAPTLGGNATTQIGTGSTNAGNVIRLEMYYYLNPPSGSQAIVSSPHATTDRNLTTVLEYTGALQGGPIGTPQTGQASSTNMDVNSIASAVGEVGVLGGCARLGTAAITASADATSPVSTERVDVPHTAGTSALTIVAYEEAGASSSIDMRVDLSESVQWAAMGVSLKPAPATGRNRGAVMVP